MNRATEIVEDGLAATVETPRPFARRRQTPRGEELF